MNEPLISVVVPSMNRAKYLRATIDSILSQRYPYIECIVMDGGSTDGTFEILRSYGDRIKWVSERDGGQSDAIDRGLRASKGEICTWLNADDVWWGPDVIAAAIEQFESYPNADVIYGECAAIDADGHHTGECYVVRGWDLRFAIEQADHCIPQPSAFIRRRALERVGFIDRSAIFMDRDLWLRIALGGDIQYVPICFSAARSHENHWHAKYRQAAEEWVATSAKIIDHPDLPIDLKVRRSLAMSNAYLRAMHYVWIGHSLMETALFGARAVRYRPAVATDLVWKLAAFAKEDDRRLVAGSLGLLLWVGRLARAMRRRFAMKEA